VREGRRKVGEEVRDKRGGRREVRGGRIKKEMGEGGRRKKVGG
jgi:hypothetical protein